MYPGLPGQANYMIPFSHRTEQHGPGKFLETHYLKTLEVRQPRIGERSTPAVFDTTDPPGWTD